MKKLLILSLTALALVAATATQAASNITNVIQDISIAFTLYPSNTTKASHGGALLTSTVKPASLGTEAVLSALRQATGAGFNPNTAKLVLLTQYTDTNVYTYTVNYVLNNQTNLQQVQVSSTEVYDSFTNDAEGYLFNLGLTNTYVESVNTNFNTAVVLTNLSTSPIYAVDDNGALTLLTNLTPYAPFSSSSLYDQTTLNPGNSTTNYYPVFGDYNQFDTNGNALTGGSPDIGLYYASNDWFFSGTTFAIDGAAVFGTSMGTTYALDSGGLGFYGPVFGPGNGGGGGIYFAMNSPADWVFNASLSGPATVATKILGTAKNAAPINYLTGIFNATGTGWMGGMESSFVYTNTSPPTTNVWVTNAIPFVLKGTVSLGAPTIKAAE
jgi:hypothetical protein